MNWASTKNESVRIKKWFIWFPMSLPDPDVWGEERWYWLENVYLKETYYASSGIWLATIYITKQSYQKWKKKWGGKTQVTPEEYERF